MRTSYDQKEREQWTERTGPRWSGTCRALGATEGNGIGNRLVFE